jgi:hypothetical protein
VRLTQTHRPTARKALRLQIQQACVLDDSKNTPTLKEAGLYTKNDISGKQKSPPQMRRAFFLVPNLKHAISGT